MKKNIFTLNIETLVLVAIWNSPFVFQGSFNIMIKDKYKELLFFRCECYLEDQMDILNKSFSSYNYKFTHLSNRKSAIHLASIDEELEHALYILKYALNETLKKMIINPKQYLTKIDEVALSCISTQIELHITCNGRKNIDNQEIGFAVSIDFTPTENIGRKAALRLVEISKNHDLLHRRGFTH